MQRLWSLIRSMFASARSAGGHESRVWSGLELLEPRILRSATLFHVDLIPAIHVLLHDSGTEREFHSADSLDQVHHHDLAPQIGTVGIEAREVAKGALETSEAGDFSTFSVVLQSEPTAEVVISIRVSDPTEGNASTTELHFTPDNWDESQTVTVTGVDDTEHDGDVEYVIEVGPATSDDPNYNGLDAHDVIVINRDDDPPAPHAPIPPSFPLPTGESEPPNIPPMHQPPPLGPPSLPVPPPSRPLPDIHVGVPEPHVLESLPEGHTFASAGSGSDGTDVAVPETNPEREGSIEHAAAEPVAPPEPVPQPPPAPVVAEVPLMPEAPPEPVAPPVLDVAVAVQHQALDGMRTQISESARRLSEEEELVVLTASGSIGIVTAGYLFWAVRGGGLVGSMMMAMPAWKLIDPIPILAYAERDRTDSPIPPRAGGVDDLFETPHRDTGGRSNGAES